MNAGAKRKLQNDRGDAGFKDLFSGDNPAKKLVRGIGMTLVSQLPGAKDEIMKRALGLKGELPDLAKGHKISVS